MVLFIRRFKGKLLPGSSIFSISCRGRKKRELNFKQFRRRNDADEIAKDYFDTNYVKILKKDWPSVRCALLSRKKYCSLLNNFADTEDYHDKLKESEAYDFISALNEKAKTKRDELELKIKELSKLTDSLVEEESQQVGNLKHETETFDKHFNELENLRDKVSIYKTLENTLGGVKAYVYPKGNFTELSEAVKDSLHLTYFLDASSILPVIALNPKPGDFVLDLCAAPGGKLNIMLQALGRTGNIVANDIDNSRVKRIKKVIKQFLPRDLDHQDFLKIVRFDGCSWGDIEAESYSKVLVDVPCTTDRHSMYTPERDVDNIFSQLRKRERARLPELQANLLRNAVQACQPGGDIVYSTCTASHLQNQYVVQYAVQNLLQNHNIICEVEDLEPMTELLKDEFHFKEDMDLGVLVYPRLDANFGPTYFCKLRRIT